MLLASCESPSTSIRLGRASIEVGQEAWVVAASVDDGAARAVAAREGRPCPS